MASQVLHAFKTKCSETCCRIDTRYKQAKFKDFDFTNLRKKVNELDVFTSLSFNIMCSDRSFSIL